MLNFMLMEPGNKTFQELIANGVKYKVPRFQRDYSWQQEQWEDLWDDINSIETEDYHYMGYIVLQRKGQYDFEVIDGQQRLITLSLIILAGMKQIQLLIDLKQDIEPNKQRLNLFYDRFIGSLNPTFRT